MLSIPTKESIIKIAKENNLRILTNLESEGLNRYSKISLICDNCHSEFTQTISNFIDNRRAHKICQRCAKIESYLDLLEKKYNRIPYEFLTELSGDRNQVIKVKCKDCGDIFETTISNTLQNSKLKNHNHPCKRCTYLRNYKKDTNYFTEKLTEKFGKCNYTLLEPEKFSGFSSSRKVKFKCNICGHGFSTYPQNIMNPTNGKHYCRVCNHKDRLLEKISYKERCLLVTNGDIEPIEEYIDSRTPIKHKCNICGYEWNKIPVKNTLRNAGCPKCTNRITQSSAELEIADFIKSIYSGEIKFKDRTILDGKEIDIYLPDISLAVEYNGLYYHSTKFKEKDYHQKKFLSLLEKNIYLISIFESDWVVDKDRVKEILKSAICNKLDSISIGNTVEIDCNYQSYYIPYFKNLGYIQDKLEIIPKQFSRNSNNKKILFPEDAPDSDILEIYDCGIMTLKKK